MCISDSHGRDFTSMPYPGEQPPIAMCGHDSLASRLRVVAFVIILVFFVTTLLLGWTAAMATGAIAMAMAVAVGVVRGSIPRLAIMQSHIC